MHRRSFLITAAAATALPSLGLAAPAKYKPGLVTKHLNVGETVFLDFTASWCSTCRAQEQVLNELKGANPAYEANITFIDVDWDKYGRSDLAKGLRIPRRSTLVVLKGDQELGRIIAQTDKTSIKGLLDTALGAATA